MILPTLQDHDEQMLFCTAESTSSLSQNAVESDYECNEDNAGPQQFNQCELNRTMPQKRLAEKSIISPWK